MGRMRPIISQVRTAQNWHDVSEGRPEDRGARSAKEENSRWSNGYMILWASFLRDWLVKRAVQEWVAEQVVRDILLIGHHGDLILRTVKERPWWN